MRPAPPGCPSNRVNPSVLRWPRRVCPSQGFRLKNRNAGGLKRERPLKMRMRTIPMMRRLLIPLCLVAGWAKSSPTVHIEGTTTLTGFEPDGSITVKQKPKHFSVWISGCQWAVRLHENTNLPNGITDVTCDSTNIYVFVPDAGGNTRIGAAQKTFAQSGTVYPGTIKVFPMRMGPIWWAFCSSCALERDGPILDFMALTPTGTQNGRTVNLKRFETNSRANRIGAVEASIFSAKSQSGNVEDSAPLAHFHPLSLHETNGYTVVASSEVLIYYPVASSGAAPRVRYEYQIDLKEFALESNAAPFVPSITRAALITDYRSPNSGEYLADHWLSADERKSAVRTPLASGSRSLSNATGKRTVVITLIIITFLAAMYFALTVLKRRKQI
jgi:hypothetical protein